MSGAQIAAYATLVVLLLVTLTGAVVLARRNLRLGRGDRRGAWRVATAIGSLYLLGLMLGADHVPSFAEVDLVLEGLAWSMLWGAMVAVGYLALEPYIRRLWPDTVVSWSRLLEGRWRDALLGRDVLLGTTVGCVLVLLQRVGAEVAMRFVHPPPRPELPAGLWLLGAPKTAGFAALLVVNGPVIAFGVLMLIVLLRMVLRRKRVAAAVLWAVLAAVGILTQAESSWIAVVTNALVWAAIIVVATRHGLAATASLVIALSMVSFALPAFTHPGWYTPEAVLLLAIPALLLAYGVVTGLGGRTILQDDLLSG
jgi:serine/threonine-protein kinase